MPCSHSRAHTHIHTQPATASYVSTRHASRSPQGLHGTHPRSSCRHWSCERACSQAHHMSAWLPNKAHGLPVQQSTWALLISRALRLCLDGLISLLQHACRTPLPQHHSQAGGPAVPQDVKAHAVTRPPRIQRAKQVGRAAHGPARETGWHAQSSERRAKQRLAELRTSLHTKLGREGRGRGFWEG